MRIYIMSYTNMHTYYFPEATNNVINDRAKEDPIEVDEDQIANEKNSAYCSIESFTRFDRPIQAESRLEDRQSDTPPLVYNEDEMSQVMMTHPQTRTDTTAATTSLESPSSNQSIGEWI